MSATYPAHREATVVLRDGSSLGVRPIRPEDEADLAHFFTDLSIESRAFRFVAAIAHADALAKKFVDIDYSGWNPVLRGHRSARAERSESGQPVDAPIRLPRTGGWRSSRRCCNQRRSKVVIQ
jgi:hypothetical protein